MSNAFAIAAVTAALRRHLRRRLDEVAVATGAVPTDYSVKSVPPFSIVLDSDLDPTLNLFLYEVTPNTGWKNEFYASHDSSGRRVTSPLLALDLHYLLTGYARDNIDAEILLTHGMQLLHETTVLSRETLKVLLNPADTPANAGTSVKFRQQAVRIADQVQQITISPVYCKYDEMPPLPKLWNPLQEHYRPGVTYKVTVLLIESRLPVKSNPPVLTIGDEIVHSGMASLSPALLLAVPPQGQPAALPTARIKVFGYHLDGKNLKAHFRHAGLGTLSVVNAAASGIVVRPIDPNGVDKLEAGVIPSIADTCLVIDLSKRDAASSPWAAGWYELTLTLAFGGKAQSSTALPVALAPGFTGAPAFSDVDGKKRVRLNLIEPLHPAQSASLFVGTREFPAVPFPPPPPVPGPAAVWNFDGVIPAEYAGKKVLFRLRVDGVESLYIERTPGKDPAFLDSQKIQLP